MTQVKTNNRDSLNLSKLAYFDLNSFKDSGEGKTLAQTLYKTDDFGNFLTNDIGYPIVDRENFKNRPDLKPLLDTLEQFPDYKETLDKYKVLTTIDKLTGYQATAFQNMDNNQVVIANRGTSGLADVVADGVMALGKTPIQFEHAQEFYQDVKKIVEKQKEDGITVPGITVTGHSLGGSLATLQMVLNYGDGFLNQATTYEEYGIEVYAKYGLIKTGIKKDFAEQYEKYKDDWNLVKTGFSNTIDSVVNSSGHIGNMVQVNKPYGIFDGIKALSGSTFGLDPYHWLDTYQVLACKDDGNFDLDGKGVDEKNFDRFMQPLTDELQAKYQRLYELTDGTGDPNSTYSEYLKQIEIIALNRQIDALSSKIVKYVDFYKLVKGTSVTPPARRDPVTVDLDGDGVETISSENGVYFDLDASGTAEKTGWIAPDDGLVVMDRDGNGTIDNGRELFGDATVIQTADGSQKIAETGFEALAAEDTNKDGVIDASDENFSNMKVWQDANQDGISQEEELRSLEETGIKKIHLDYLTVNTEDEQGNIQTRTSGFEFTDGRNGLTSEFLFDRDVVDTGTTDFSDVPDEIKNMAYLRGFGDVTDLYHAMKDDEVLRGLVEEFSDPENAASARTNFEKVLFRWTGVADISPSSRGGNIDARRLAVLERFFADDFEGWGAVGRTSKSSNPNAAAAVQLNSVYNNIFNSFSTTMNLQTHLKEYVTLGAIELNEDGTININNEVSDFLLNFQKLSDEIETGDEGPQTGDGETYLEKFELLARTVGVLGAGEQNRSFADYFTEKDSRYLSSLRYLKSDTVLNGGDGNDRLYGTSADEILIGNGGDDIINAGSGHDTVYGGAGHDKLYGESGNDTLIGGEGNDKLYGERSNDILDGGTGNDYLNGDEENDTYIYRRGDGSDVIQEDDIKGDDTDILRLEDLNKEDIADIIKSGNHLTIKFKDTDTVSGDQIRFNDWFRTHSDNKYNKKIEGIEFADGSKWTTASIESRINLYGGEGNDTIIGSSGSNKIYAYEGNDTVNAGSGNDTVYGGAGHDKLYGESGNDTLIGGEGNDKLYGERSNDILDGGTGNDYLNGDEENDTYIYRRGDGSDVIQEDDIKGDDTDILRLEDLNKEDIADIIKSGNHLTIKFKDTDTVSGDQIRFNDWFRTHSDNKYNKKIEGIEFADGSKWTTGSIESRINLYGGEGNDTIIGSSGSNKIYAYEGNDTVNAGSGHDTVYGGAGHDKLYGESGNDTLIGGEGNDKLYGERSNDILDGGTGNDYLNGDEENDTYIYRRGDGSDVIQEDDIKGDDTDILRLEDLNKEDIADIIKSGNHLTIKFKDTDTVSGDQIRFNDWFRTHSDNKYNKKIEGIEFADGSKWTTGSIESRINLYGGEGNDTIIGSSGSNKIYAYEGNDTVNAGSGHDTVYGGAGHDKLYGESGNDTLIGGEGNDKLYGERSNDILDGGTGNDYLNGDEENDTYIYRRGDGSDVIQEDDIKGDDTDILRLEDLNKEDIADIIKSGNHLTIKFKDTDTVSGDQIRFNDWFRTHSDNKYNKKIEGIEFADGSKWTTGSIESRINLYGGEGNDTIIGSSGSNKIYAYEGNDTVNAGRGNDTVYGGAGHDKLYGESGNDTLIGGEGNDKLYGERSNDILDGGTGNDYLNGDEENDTYIYRRGDGSDVIQEDDIKGDDTDILRLEDLNKEDIADIIKSGNHLTIKFKDTDTVSGDQIRFNDWFRTHSDNKYNKKIEGIEFADGSKWTTASIESRINLYGGEGNDTIIGSSGSNKIYAYEGNDTVNAGRGNDTVYGGAGHDKLYGESGNDTLIGGEGNDKLYGERSNDILDGGTGNDYLNGDEENDTYIYRRGDGSDVIQEDDIKGDDTDILRLEDLNKEDIADIIKSGNHLTIKFKDTDTVSGDQIRFNDWFRTHSDNKYNKKIEGIEFADGSKWTTASIERFRVVHGSGDDDVLTGTSAKENIYGYDGNDTISGGSGNDVITGDAGDDVIDGGSGNDRIIGGKGNDILSGGEGSDFYIYTAGDGSDIINEVNDLNSKSLNTDTLFLKGIVPDGINKIVRTEDDLKIHILREGSDDDIITVKDWYNTEGNVNRKIEKIVFNENSSDAPIWTTNDIESRAVLEPLYDNVVTGTDGADTVRGVAGKDFISGGAGNDTILGYDGDDIISGGSGNDRIYGGNGNDTVTAEEGDNYISSDRGDDTVTTGSGNDYIKSGYGNDIVDAGEGDNRIYASAGDDIITSGTGNDRIYAGDGADKIESVGGDNYICGDKGDDTITTTSGNDLIKGGTGNDVVNSGDGNDTIYGDIGEDIITSSGGDNYILSGKDDDTITVGDGKDYIIADSGNDTVDAGDGNNSIFGGSGDDVVTSGIGDDRIYGGDGNDTITSTGGDNYVSSDDGDDTVTTGSGDDFIKSGYGNDTVNVGEGDNRVYASAGNDEINSGSGADRIYGGDGNDTITSSGGDNYVSSNKGDDTVTTGSGNDYIKSGYGNDTVNVGEGDNRVYGSAGDDTITSGIGADRIYGGDGNDTITSSGGDNYICGDKGDDVVTSGSGNDYIKSGTGSDTVNSGDGNDRIYGGSGNDNITGGKGNDTLLGESGDDTYNFSSGDGQDYIKDTDGNDTLKLGVDSTDVRLQRAGRNLEILLRGSEDKMTVSGWFSSDRNKIEQIETSDYGILLHKQADLLIQEMAAFEDEKGISWTTAIDQENQEAKDITAAHWKFEEPIQQGE